MEPVLVKQRRKAERKEDSPEPLHFGVDFPFRITIAHPELDLATMFAVTECFDFYEVNGVAGENRGHHRKDLYIDVLEITPTSTCLRVTPSRLMMYAEIGAELQQLVEGVGERFMGGKARVAQIQWIVDRTGIASDLRGRLRTVG
jgi:hypothetical protein